MPDEELLRWVLAVSEAEGFSFSGTSFTVLRRGGWKRASFEIRKTVMLWGVVPVETRFEMVKEMPVF